MRTRGSGTRWPSDAAPGDYPVACGICSAVWLRSQMRMDGARRLVCPDEGDGLDEVTLAQMDADALARMREHTIRRDGLPPQTVSNGLDSLGTKLLHWFQVPTTGSRYLGVSGSELVTLSDRASDDQIGVLSYANPLLYAESGGPNSKPYLYGNNDYAPDGRISGFTSRRLRGARRVAFYAVAKSRLGFPIYCLDTGTSAVRFSVEGQGDGTALMRALPGSAQSVSVDSGGEWGLFSVEYLSDGCTGKLDGTAASPDFTAGGYTEISGDVMLEIGYSADDGFAMLCVVADPSDETDATVRAHVLAEYAL